VLEKELGNLPFVESLIAPAAQERGPISRDALRAFSEYPEDFFVIPIPSRDLDLLSDVAGLNATGWGMVKWRVGFDGRKISGHVSHLLMLGEIHSVPWFVHLISEILSFLRFVYTFAHQPMQLQQ
jgi:hypothetical protein